MKKTLFPSHVVVLITTALEIQAQDEKPSFLLKDYDLPTMISFFRKKISEEITLDALEKIFLNPAEPVPVDTARFYAVITTGKDFTEKIQETISLYKKAYDNSKDFLVIMLAKLLFSKESWLREHEDEASKLFQRKDFSDSFFDQRKSCFCLHDDEEK